MKETTKDFIEVFVAYQKTIDFHMMQVQGLFPSCRATLIVRDPADGDIIMVYSNDKAEYALRDAVKKLKDNKKKRASKKTKKTTKKKAKKGK